MSHDTLIKEVTQQGGGFWCESCNAVRTATKIVRHIFKSGRELQVSWCGECGSREETEFFKGPTVRIKNREA